MRLLTLLAFLLFPAVAVAQSTSWSVHGWQDPFEDTTLHGAGIMADGGASFFIVCDQAEVMAVVKPRRFNSAVSAIASMRPSRGCVAHWAAGANRMVFDDGRGFVTFSMRGSKAAISQIAANCSTLEMTP